MCLQDVHARYFDLASVKVAIFPSLGSVFDFWGYTYLKTHSGRVNEDIFILFAHF